MKDADCSILNYRARDAHGHLKLMATVLPSIGGRRGPPRTLIEL